MYSEGIWQIVTYNCTG